MQDAIHFLSSVWAAITESRTATSFKRDSNITRHTRAFLGAHFFLADAYFDATRVNTLELDSNVVSCEYLHQFWARHRVGAHPHFWLSFLSILGGRPIGILW